MQCIFKKRFLSCIKKRIANHVNKNFIFCILYHLKAMYTTNIFCAVTDVTKINSTVFW